jgi:hypothetical protein
LDGPGRTLVKSWALAIEASARNGRRSDWRCMAMREGVGCADWVCREGRGAVGAECWLLALLPLL